MARTMLASWCIISFLIYGEGTTSENYCYMNDTSEYLYFGTKTSYEETSAKNMVPLRGCEVRYVWALIRHGTRYGRSKFHKTDYNVTKIKNEIIENHEVYKRGKLCDEDLRNLKNWTYKWINKEPLGLTEQGVAEMKGIAARLKNKFGTYFAVPEKQFVIQSSSRVRCQRSSIVFSNELFRKSQADLATNNVVLNDKLLRFMDGFLYFDENEELRKFKKSKAIRKMIDEVGHRLGYETKLSFEFVYELYEYCAFENAWSLHSRPGFCAAFTNEHLKILEYLLDLSDYNDVGYGNQTIMRLACPVARDIFVKLSEASNEASSSGKGAFYFTHAEVLLPTLARLKLFHDREPLKYNNYKNQYNRQWRTSLISSFAANFFVILHNCSNEFKVVFYNNEKLMLFPGCRMGICSMKKFQKIFTQKILNDCPPNGSSILAVGRWLLPVMTARIWLLVFSSQ